MRQFWTTVVPVCVAVALLGGDARADGNTSPGKNPAFGSASGLSLVASSEVLAVTLEKGKKKRVLAVEAMVVAPAPAQPFGRVLVNGLVPEPSTPGAVFAAADCSESAQDCAATGTFWLDLDAAEAASPGTFINQPLIVTLRAGDDALTGSTTGVATLTARLEKK